jgi:hypothetical protein
MPLFPFSPTRPDTTPERPAMVSHVGREDVLWNRPVFRAPPLEQSMKKIDVRAFAEELRRIGRGER